MWTSGHGTTVVCIRSQQVSLHEQDLGQDQAHRIAARTEEDPGGPILSGEASKVSDGS